MTLFWKIYAGVFVLLLVTVVPSSYMQAHQQLASTERALVEEYETISHLLYKQMEVGYQEERWPFESLSNLSQRHGTLFWWVVKDDGTIYLANDAKFMGTEARQYFPDIEVAGADQVTFMRPEQNLGVVVQPLHAGRNRWSFWLGFSTEDVAAMRRHILLTNGGMALLTLLAIGAALYGIVRYYTRPVRSLAAGAAALGGGNLSYRVRVESNDELGQLARSFNTMAEDLQRTTVDITLLKRAEENLRESESWLRTVLDNVQTGILLIDVGTHKIVEANDVALKSIGLPRDQVLGNVCHRYVCPAEEGKCPIDLGQTVDRSERMLVRGDGSLCPIIKTVVPLTLHGRPYLLESFLDISDRKRMEEALRDSREFLNKIINTIRDPIIVQDSEHRFELVNDAFCALAGKTQESLLGGTIHQTLPPDQVEDIWRVDEEVVQSGQDNTREEDISPRPGAALSVVTKKSLYVDPEGKRHLVGIVRDVTERKQLEDALRQSRDLLEQRVLERTADLTAAHQRIQQAQADLIQSEKMGMLGQLVAGVAHEINTPTGAILNVTADTHEHLLGLVQASAAIHSLPPEEFQWLTGVGQRLLSRPIEQSEAATRSLRREIEKELQTRGMDNSRRLAGIIAGYFGAAWRSEPNLLEHLQNATAQSLLEELLNLKASAEISFASAQKIARIVRALRYYSHSGQNELIDINLNESIDNTLVILQNRIKHLAEVKTAMADDLPPVRCAAEISQVWTNILNNACDAIEEAGRPGLIEITSRVEGDRAVVEIYDNGPEIPEAVMRKIYDPFFTTKPVGKGTGLGLGICTGILRRCGGVISARNERGGVTFTVTVPLGQAPGVRAAEAVAAKVSG